MRRFGSSSDNISSKIITGILPVVFSTKIASDSFNANAIVLACHLEACFPAIRLLNKISISSLWGPYIETPCLISLSLYLIRVSKNLDSISWFDNEFISICVFSFEDKIFVLYCNSISSPPLRSMWWSIEFAPVSYTHLTLPTTPYV